MDLYFFFFLLPSLSLTLLLFLSRSLPLSLSHCSVRDQLQSLLVPEQGVEQGLQNSNFVAERLESEDEGAGLHRLQLAGRLECLFGGKCTAHSHL